MASVWGELKRRNVVRVAVAYAIAAWLLIEITATTFPILKLPDWSVTLVTVLVLIGFPLALILAWAFELTPAGVKRDQGAQKTEGATPSAGRNFEHVIVGVLGLSLIGAGVYWYLGRDARWAREEVIPQIEQQVNAGDFESAFALAKKAQKVLPNDPTLTELLGRFTWITSIPSEPPGATVFRRAYSTKDAEWENLGTTPLHDLRFPDGLSLLRIELDGHRSLLRVIGGGYMPTQRKQVMDRSQGTKYRIWPERYVLDTDQSLPEDMVRVPGRSVAIDGELTELTDFFIARFEVTNREFKQFVDAGGYHRRDLWEHEFVLDGETIPCEQAIRRFTDRSDRPGPSGWQGGGYPAGEDDHPVTGVSWYEAAAYARFVGRDLPTIYHWRRAFATGTFSWLLPVSNLESDGTAPVGLHQGVGWTGTFDMGGNAREWCFNAIGDQRVILGGGWNDALYVVRSTIQDPGKVPPFDRSPTNGLRLAIASDNQVATQRLRAPVPESTNAEHSKPVSEEVFAAYLSNYEYDPQPFNAAVEATKSEHFWTRETISFDAGYGDERMFLYLYLPTNEASPFQTIIYWPGLDAMFLDSIDAIRVHLDFALKNGRAVAFPVLKGTYQRRFPSVPAWTSIARRDLAIQQVRDLRRAIDYLETRRDIDSGALAYYGLSWGGQMAAIVLAVEPRLKLGILNQAGILSNVHHDFNNVHYLPRVTVPVLQFNGMYDTDFPLESSAMPFFELLATPDADKKHVVELTGHFVPQPIYIGETLDWLDKYLGPPN